MKKQKRKAFSSKPTSYKEIILLPKDLKKYLPTSYDIIGNIILVKINEEIKSYKKEIGKALLEKNKNVKTICSIQPVKGELRTRNLEIIAGEKNTITQHNEFGLKIEVDVKKTYFSPRLANERKYISSLVQKDEIVVDMFAGVAPFSIMIAKYSNPKIIYALDKNKYAIEYAKKNIKINNVLDKVEVIQTDSKNIEKILGKKGVRADRIIMNLPFFSSEFLTYSFLIGNKRYITHLYRIIKENDINKEIIKIKKIAKQGDIKIDNLKIRKIKTYAPREFYMGIDITAKKLSPM